jgi:TolB-like protein/Tfp pilus assembly protein PilF
MVGRSGVKPCRDCAAGHDTWLSTAAVTGGLIFLLVLSTVGWRRRIFQAHASTRIQAIAVLPLQNLSGDPAQEYFADGMTDALITNLAHISSVQVISRTSVMLYKNSREPLSKISKDLNVDAVVEGSVVRAGNRVRINTQLIDASSDRHVWAGAFERDMSDVLTLQDEAAKSIATEIAANLTHQNKLQRTGAKTVNSAAYEAYLKANYFYAKQTSDGFEKAKQYYEQSIALDPTYAPAYVGLAEVYAWLAYTQRQAPAAASVTAESLLARALEIYSASSDAYVMRGMIKLQYRCDRAGAEKDLTHALELDPTNISALDYHSYYLLEIGRRDEAIAEKKRVVALDPVSVGTICELGLYYVEAGRNEEAIQELQRGLELDPNFAAGDKRLGRTYANEGHFDQAVAELQRGIALDQTPGALEQLGDYYARSGNKQEALRTIEELKTMSKRSYASPALAALIYARLGDENQALEWLAKAKPEDQVDTSDSDFDFVRSNARFRVIEARLKPKDSFIVSAEAAGFAVSIAIIEVIVATPVRVDITMRVQTLQQSVKVEGKDGLSVQSQSAGLGRTISPTEMSNLPSLTRTPYDFIAIVPGANLSNDQTGVGFAVNGGRTQSANYLLDGGENNDAFMSAPAQDVPLDSIEEFSVQTNHFSAEYGRNSAFIANIVTKSGTNSFHGSAYEYIRNSVLAANTYENNSQGLPRSVFDRNQFGGTLGGPILHQKLFFFASVEPILVRSTTTNLFYVPTPELLAISAPGTQAIFQRFPLPTTLSMTDVLQRKVCPFGADCDTGAGFVTLPAFARTSRTGPQDAGAGSPQSTILATGRVDWLIDSKMQAFARYAFENQNEFPAVFQPFSNELDVPNLGKNQSIALNLIRTWSTNTATESRLVYSRIFGNPDRFTGINPTVPQPTFPTFAILNEPTVTLPGGTSLFGGPQNTYRFFQTVTWVHDHHSLRFGGQFIQMRDNRSFGISEIGDATFANTQGFVNALLFQYQIAIDPKGHFPGEFVDPPFGPPSFERHYRYNEPALFVEDTWRPASRLTVTPGLRWEYFGVFHSPGADHPLDANFYPGPGDSYLEQVANGRILRTVDAPGNLRGRFYVPDYRNFAPRLGAAYDLSSDGRSVLRAGAGVFYDRRVGYELFRAFQNPPNYSVTTLKNIVASPELASDQYAVFLDEPIQLNLSDTKAPATNLRTAYTVSWNATFEHEFAKTMIFGASYLGSSGSRLYTLNNVNRLGSGGLLDPSCIAKRFASDGVTPLAPDYTNCGRLNPNVTTIAIRGNGAHATFNALQLRLDSQKIDRFALEFGASYTWSHSIDDASSSGGNDPVASSNGPWFLSAFQANLER